MRDIGKNIRELRIRKSMTQDDLAEKLFVTRQTVSNYETGKSRPDVEMLLKIGEVLDADIQHLIYGPEKLRLTGDLKRLILGAAAVVMLALVWVICEPVANTWKVQKYMMGPTIALRVVVKPLMLLSLGWVLGHLLVMALRLKPFGGNWCRYARIALTVLLAVWLVVSVCFSAYCIVDEWLYASGIRGTWEEQVYETGGQMETTKAWIHNPLPGLTLLNRFLIPAMRLSNGVALVLIPLLGGAARLLESPKDKKTPD